MNEIRPSVLGHHDVVSFCPRCLESWTYNWSDIHNDKRTSMLLEMELYTHLDAHPHPWSMS